MNKSAKFLVLGSSGLVGSSLIQELKSQGYSNILAPRRSELDLFAQQAVIDYFKQHSPEYVFLAAARVGGIHANNTYRADFLFENLQIQNNIYLAMKVTPVERFCFLGSSCIYPKQAPQPIKESYLLTDSLEPTNEPYAIAKIAGLKLAETFREQYDSPYFAVMPCNLYGPKDNFHLENSHVIPGLMRRMKEARENEDKEFSIWGSGKPKREFLFVEDLASILVRLMAQEDLPPVLVNIGKGEDISIGELAEMIKEIVGFKGELVFDSSRPDGTMRKVLDTSLMKSLGMEATTSLQSGLQKTYDWYSEHCSTSRS